MKSGIVISLKCTAVLLNVVQKAVLTTKASQEDALTVHDSCYTLTVESVQSELHLLCYTGMSIFVISVLLMSQIGNLEILLTRSNKLSPLKFKFTEVACTLLDLSKPYPEKRVKVCF